MGSSLSTLAYQIEPDYYNYTGSYSSTISTACDSYTLSFTPMTQAEIQEVQFWERVDREDASYDDYWTQDFLLDYQGENPRKYLLLFGSADKRRFASKEEADASMTTISVPVWKLSNGVKTPSTMSLTVHTALAQDVTDIFTEIYNDSEQFPIHDVGGYSWREATGRRRQPPIPSAPTVRWYVSLLSMAGAGAEMPGNGIPTSPMAITTICTSPIWAAEVHTLFMCRLGGFIASSTAQFSPVGTSHFQARPRQNFYCFFFRKLDTCPEVW